MTSNPLLHIVLGLRQSRGLWPSVGPFCAAAIAAGPWLASGLFGCAAASESPPRSPPAATPSAAPRAATNSEEAEGLDALAVRRVVAAHQAELQSACWLPALAQRSPDAGRGARVFVSLEVDEDGKVVIVTPSDEPPGYAGLAGCVTAQVRTWQFPASGAITRVNLPFVFREEPPAP